MADVIYTVWIDQRRATQYLEKSHGGFFSVFFEHSGNWDVHNLPLDDWCNQYRSPRDPWTILIASDDLGIILEHARLADDIKTGICRWLM